MLDIVLLDFNIIYLMVFSMYNKIQFFNIHNCIFIIILNILDQYLILVYIGVYFQKPLLKFIVCRRL